MVAEITRHAKAGRPRSVERSQILEAAAQIADDRGLDAVSFRVLGDKLGVSAMSVHRTMGGLDALHSALISTVVGDVATRVSWPADWRGTVRTFAIELRGLLLRHPLVLEAHRRSALEAPGADEAARIVVTALETAGLDASDAAYAYATIHDFVTGHVAIRLGRGDFELETISPERRAASVFLDHHDYDRRFDIGLRIVLDGIAALMPR